MDSASSAFSRLSLGDVLTPPGTTNTPNSVSSDTDIFQFDKFIAEILDSELQIFDEDEFEKGKFLGAGRTMSTYEGWWKSKSVAVALKYINFAPSVGASSAAARDPEFQAILRSAALELRVLRHESARVHPNIVDILAVSWHQLVTATGSYEIYPILVMELACPEHPTIGELIRKKHSNLSLPIKLSLLRDVFEGISTLHELGVVHGDLKPENVLVFREQSGKLTAKISDFGFSQADSGSRGRDFEAGGTEYWNAPECLPNAPESLASFKTQGIRDIYSFALFCAFVLLEELPFALQGWNIAQISSMKLQDEISDLFGTRWRFAPTRNSDDSRQWGDLRMSDTELSEGPHTWEVQQQDGWCKAANLPLPLLALIPKMLLMDPSSRPSIDTIRDAFRTCTGDRGTSTQRKNVYNNGDTSKLLLAGTSTSVMGTRANRAHNLCDPAIPPALRFALFKTFLIAARDQNHAKRTKAMVNIGYCMLNAFGTRYDVSEAMVWFGRAGMEGDTTGQEMVFRLERIVKQNAIELVLGLNKRMRVNWMVTCLLRNLGPGQLPDIMPPELRLEQPQDRLKDILLGFDPEFVENGLQRAVDDAIVRTLALKRKDYSQNPTWRTFPGLWNSIVSDEPAIIDRLFAFKDPRLSPNIRDVIVSAAVEMRSLNILRCLAHNHGFQLDETFEHALVQAFMKSDTQMVALLIDLGVPWQVMLSSNAANAVLIGCTVPTIEIALGLLALLKVVDDGLEYAPYWDPTVIRRETMDGIQPLMSNQPSHDEMIDNFKPPIFQTIAHNRFLNLWLILSLGGNPNIRYMGMTALHLAVKTLRPLLVGMLLAFGADPNARDFKNEYETPLHQISGEHVRPMYMADDEYFDFLDVFGDKFTPATAYPDEDNHHRRLIIRLLIEYGADINALCSGGLTPITKAVLSPSPHAPTIAKYLIELGADPSRTGVFGLSSIHAVSAKGSLQLLRHILYLPGHAMINQRSSVGVTPLMAACTDDDRARHVIELLEAGADMTIRSNGGHNALSKAMQNAQKTIFNTLVDHITQLPARARDAILVANRISGSTAAHDAFESKDPAMITYFLEKLSPLMSDFHGPSKAGLTPLHLAVVNKNIPAMKFILENKADVNAKALQGMTALHLAYGSRESALVQFLLSWNADTSIRNDQGLTPRELELKCARDASFMDGFFEEVNRIQKQGIEGISSQEDELRGERYKQQLIEDSQYVPNDRFTRDMPASPKSITKIEDVHVKMLESSIAKNGEQHYVTLWRMNNLGSVYERYGRVTRAEELYRKGWHSSLQVLGNSHLLTADFANKLSRILEDTGRAKSHRVLEQWISRFGKDTLTPPLFKFAVEPDREKFNAMPTYPKPTIEDTCSRLQCKNSSQLECPECSVFRYCSSSCRDADWADDSSSHRRECMHSLTPEENPAIVSKKLTPADPGARQLANLILSRIMTGFIDSDFGENIPTVNSAHMIYFNPKTFHTPTRFRTKKNMAVMFMSEGGCKYMFKATNNQWKTSRRHDMMLLYEEVDFWIAPQPGPMPQGSTAAADGTTVNAELVLMVDYIYLDFPKAEERRKQRLSTASTGIRIIECDYAGQPQS